MSESYQKQLKLMYINVYIYHTYKLYIIYTGYVRVRLVTHARSIVEKMGWDTPTTCQILYNVFVFNVVFFYVCACFFLNYPLVDLDSGVESHYLQLTISTWNINCPFPITMLNYRRVPLSGLTIVWSEKWWRTIGLWVTPFGRDVPPTSRHAQGN